MEDHIPYNNRNTHNVDNFVSGNTLVFDNEIFKYLSSILSDKKIFEKEIQEILFYETIDMPFKKRQRSSGTCG